jgi:hypothetical protein
MALVAAACSLQPAIPTATPVPPTTAPEPTLPPPTVAPTPEPATALPEEPPKELPTVVKLGPPEGAEILYDFTEHLCEAAWVNNGAAFDCPGDAAKTDLGYVAIIEEPLLNNIFFDNKALLIIPAYNGQFLGAFGRFPARTIQTGDKFYAGLTCLNEDCNVEFALEYYDAQGVYHDDLAVSRPYQNPAAGDEIADITLDALAGQTVELTLVVRSQNFNNPDEALWIAPVLWRLP